MFIVGIAGGSGSGKSTIVGQLLARFGNAEITFLPHDAYYLNAAAMPSAIREAGNWDHPEALDNRLFIEQIDALSRGEAIDRPIYDFTTHSRTTDTVRVEPSKILLVEGILLFAVPELRERMDLRVYVETTADLRLARRILRDIADRGRTLASVLDQYQSTVRPMQNTYVEPNKCHAHLVIPWETDNPEAVELLVTRLRQAMTESAIGFAPTNRQPYNDQQG